MYWLLSLHCCGVLCSRWSCTCKPLELKTCGSVSGVYILYLIPSELVNSTRVEGAGLCAGLKPPVHEEELLVSFLSPSAVGHSRTGSAAVLSKTFLRSDCCCAGLSEAGSF